tara:strand:- start:1050 stop:1214 length:165 start_codon:yes stop_codon:yes gene_type:complete
LFEESIGTGICFKNSPHPRTFDEEKFTESDDVEGDMITWPLTYDLNRCGDFKKR